MPALQPRFAIAVAVLALSSVIVSAAEPASAKSVAEASKSLEAARSKLSAAVKRIEVDAPSTPELEAAHDAVERLQEALTAGAAFETADLDYAKAVLAARKELRTQREYVEQRRANVAIFDLRRKIDAAVQVMDRRVTKDLAADQLEAARADVAAVKQLVAQTRKFSKQDPKVGPYLDGVDAAAAKQEKAIGDRWFQLSADKQRGLLEQASKGLSTAVSDLAAGFSDAKFEAADKAVVLLAKTVADGKPLEERDRSYRAEADKARAMLAQAKTKTEEAVAAAGVARVKTELEAPFGELKESMKTLRAGKATEEQLNEAKTATFVVRKLVDKYAVQGTRSPAIAQYLQSLKDVLNEAEVLLQTKALLRARSEVNAALRALSKRLPSDDEFAEAKASVVVLEKSLETITAKDVKLANAAAEAKQAVKDSRAEIEKRRYQVDLTLQRNKTDEARRAAGALISQLNQGKPTDQQLAEAEKALKEANDVLAAGAPFVKKDADYKAFDLETKAKLADLADRIARKRVALNASNAKETLVELIAGTQAKIEAAKVASASDEDLAAASNGVEAVGHAIQERAALAKQDAALAAYLDRARNELNRMMENLDLASRMRQLRKSTGDALTAANNALKEAEGSSDPRKRKSLYETTTQTLKSCKEEGPRMLVENPKLVNIDVLVSGQALKPREVVAQCIEKFDSMSDTIKLTIAQVRFEDGPKKAYEKAKSLLDQGKRDEAKAQFDECFATGVIEQQRYPEYKERKNSVAGTSLTVRELIQKCDVERKALKASK